MNFMKKAIISIIFVLTLFFITSCKKQDEFYIEKRSYNLINEDLSFLVLSKEKNSVYMKIENILNSFIIDNNTNELLQVKIKKINNVSTNKKNIFEIIIDKSFYESDEIIINNAKIRIEYINNKIIDFNIGSVYLVSIEESFDLRVKTLKAIVEDKIIKSIILNIENPSSEIIKISNIRLINGKFRADFKNLKEKDEEKLILYPKTIIKISLPIICENPLNTYESAIIIDYSIENQIKHKIIKNFVFVKTFEEKKVEQSVAY